MGQIFLVLMTLNAHTGQIMHSHVIRDHPYGTVAECMRAAIEKGPQPVSGDVAKVFSCTDADTHAVSAQSATS